MGNVIEFHVGWRVVALKYIEAAVYLLNCSQHHTFELTVNQSFEKSFILIDLSSLQ